MAINTLKASLAAATSEITFAAANLNLDFSLFKFEAPATYQPFGMGLSSKRRNEAEHGTTHTTARKLGALFERLLPPTPKLVDVYGTRVSELAARPDVNPQGSALDGLFSGQIGADGTTIWAAATSGPGAVPVHLLACLLARRWNAQYATSIWAEIVEERKKEIVEGFEKDNSGDFATLQAARQDITRDQLAEWDASARAWLRTADSALKKEVDQLRSIIAELNLPIGNEGNTYKNVLDTWKTAMTTMENVIDGQAQTIYSGSALLGLSSWHIFPDLVLLRDPVTEVKFSEPLVKPGGILTVGLEIPSDDKEFDLSGVEWSLSLAHLRYYGPPIVASSSIENANSRVYFNEFAIISLGALSIVLNCSVNEAAEFFSSCLDQISDMTDGTRASFRIPGSTTKNQVRHYLADDGSWINVLARASSTFLEGTDLDLKTARMLTKCGTRHGKEFFCPPSGRHGCLFGMCSPDIILQLLPNSNLRVNLLRKMASRIHHGPGELLIRYQADVGPLDEQPADETCAIIWEFATAFPQPRKSIKRDRESNEKSNARHKRWAQLEVFGETMPCRCTGSCDGCCCRRSCKPACHLNRVSSECMDEIDEMQKLMTSWGSYIEDLDEDADIVLDPWTEVAMANSNGNSKGSFSKPYTRPEEFYFSREPGQKPVRYVLVAGDPKTAALYLESHAEVAQSVNGGLPQSSQYLNSLNVQDVVDLIRSHHISAHRIVMSLKNLESNALNSLNNGHITTQSHLFRSLRALSLADKVYKMLPSATVAIRTISLPFYESRWIPRSFRTSEPDSSSLPRASAFSCVAMFESGHLNIDPSTLTAVFALSSVDSLFIACALVCDPAEKPHEFELKRVVGNIGRAGMALLIPPQISQVKSLVAESWNLLTHADFDGRAEDCFGGTSMHLSFSGYKLPLHTGIHGSQDVDAYLLESIIQVRDQGKWVADIDVLNVVDSNIGRIDRHPGNIACSHESLGGSEMGLTSIDSWDELIEGPESTSIARAHGNWLSRLALTCVAAHKGHNVYILPSSFCWTCAMYLAGSSNRALAAQTLQEARGDLADSRATFEHEKMSAAKSESTRSGFLRGHHMMSDEKNGDENENSSIYLSRLSATSASAKSHRNLARDEGSPPPVVIPMEVAQSLEVEMVSKEKLLLVL